MMDLLAELKATWDKYEPQREAERNAARIQEEARKDLAELNAKRLKAGLVGVGEQYAPTYLQGAQFGTTVGYVGAPPKTWRDELDAELLSAVRRHFA